MVPRATQATAQEDQDFGLEGQIQLRGFGFAFGVITGAALHEPIDCAELSKFSGKRLSFRGSKFKRAALRASHAGGSQQSRFKFDDSLFKRIYPIWRVLDALPYIPTPQQLGNFAKDRHDRFLPRSGRNYPLPTKRRAAEG